MRIEGLYEKDFFSKLWEYDVYYKVGNITKGLEGFAWIKSRVDVQKTFKNWKALSTSTPPKKGWSFLVNQVRRATIEK